MSLYRAHLASSSNRTGSPEALLQQDEREGKQRHDGPVTSVPKHHRKEEGKGDDGVGCYEGEGEGEGNYIKVKRKEKTMTLTGALKWDSVGCTYHTVQSCHGGGGEN